MRFPIIRTKLNRPRLRSDLICRERLEWLLDNGREGTLTWVSAPAGYGKSTAVAHWLEKQTDTCVWVSLASADSDLQQFLGYLLTGIRSEFPDTCPQTWSIIRSGHLPSAEMIAGILVNEIVDTVTPLILVLDDYHHIGDSSIHEFLEQLLTYPPPLFHLVIITRRDPPLSLAALRADARITEIRQRELQFNDQEVESFFHKNLFHSEYHSFGLFPFYLINRVTYFQLFLLFPHFHVLLISHKE